MRRTFYRAGAELSVQGAGQAEGMQRITALRRQGIKSCPKSGCLRYERGYEIVLNLADPEDVNLARYIHEGRVGRYIEERLGHGLVKVRFPPGYCPGHKIGWEDDLPVYVVGERKTVHDEYHHRYQTGSEALVAARTRQKEMNNG